MTRRGSLAALVLLASLVQVVLAAPAQAYVDPGTGSFIFQAIVAAFVSSVVTIKLYWRRIRSALGRGLSQADEPREAEAREPDRSPR